MLPVSNIIFPSLRPLVDLIEKRIGMSVTPDQFSDLYNTMNRLATSLGYRSVGRYIEELLKNHMNYEQLNLLVYELTNGESYFFRESEYLRAVFIINYDWVQKTDMSRRQLRIWSAGCSCGQEPYSIAMLLDRFFPKFYDADLSILGTDINTEFLVTARQALYKTWSFRNSLSELMGHYFTKQQHGGYRLKESIREKVQFKQLNLMDSVYPDPEYGTAEIHYLFCRNVLSYMTQDAIEFVLKKFWRALRPNGWLVVGRFETGLVNHPGFRAMNVDGITLFQKKNAERSGTAEQKAVRRNPSNTAGNARLHNNI